MVRSGWCLSIAAGGILAAATLTPALAQGGADFFKGKTVTYIVATAAGAAYLAARATLTDEQREHLERAHAEVSAARKPAEHRQADSRFHLTVAALSGSSRTVEAVTSVQATLHEMLLAIPVLGTNISHSDRQHATLVRAIEAGNAEKARKTMEQHCDDTAALLRGLVG